MQENKDRTVEGGKVHLVEEFQLRVLLHLSRLVWTFGLFSLS